MVRNQRISFSSIVWKTGNANVLTVPARYVKDGHIAPGKEYRVTIKEVSEDESES